MAIYITDDGDETVFVKIEEETIAEIGHGPYGWEGMEAVIKLVEDIAEAHGIEVVNVQDIV